MQFRKDYPNGTVIRQIVNGLEGIIIDIDQPFSGFIRYIVEMKHGETEIVNVDNCLPVEHPANQLLDQWREHAKKAQVPHLIVGHDKDGEWFHLHAHTEQEAKQVMAACHHSFVRTYNIYFKDQLHFLTHADGEISRDGIYASPNPHSKPAPRQIDMRKKSR